MPLALAPPRGTVLVRDCLEADAAFLLVQLIKAALAAEGSSSSTGGGGSGGGVLAAAQRLPTPAAAAAAAALGDTSQHCSRVLLLAVAQTASHYAAVLRKAGLSLPALVSAGRLALVELLPGLATAVPAESELPALRAVHERLAAAVAGSSSSSTGGVCLVVDDLTALHCLADSPAEWTAFLHACTSLGQGPGSAFVCLAHSGVPDDEGWLARLEHAAAVVVDVEPLESGRSTDTTGRLAVTVRNVALPSTAAAAAAAAAAVAPGLLAAAAGGAGGGAAPGTRHFCYKLGETGASYVEQAPLAA